ncbi:uncharacterized protein DEA37_0012433 [Paragonimus westermani]|uniref:Uncharacterized protein n=1 Tax=Paragonimus westermani TaxID=34504 RepID=A0A5J4N3M6_9TREM|nr:uncharacterized protein DEA37_0012433 [Paragonimus westermani]
MTVLLWLLIICAQISHSILRPKCCIHGRNICESLKISVFRFGSSCMSALDQIHYLTEYGFQIEQNASLSEGHYSIVAINGDLAVGVKDTHFARISFAAINILTSCLQDSVRCVPPDSITLANSCKTEWDVFEISNLFLFRQTKQFEISHVKLMASGQYTFQTFYNRSLFSGSPLRCNRYLIRRCRHATKYNEITGYSEFGTPLTDPPDSRELPYKMGDTLSQFFAGITITKSTVDKEANSCFIQYELDHPFVSKENSLAYSGVGCAHLLSNWSQHETRMQITRIANEWFIFAQQEYVHYQFTNAYFVKLQSAWPENMTDVTMLRKRDVSLLRMKRIVARLHVFTEVFSHIDQRWTPPLDHFTSEEISSRT